MAFRLGKFSQNILRNLLNYILTDILVSFRFYLDLVVISVVQFAVVQIKCKEQGRNRLDDRQLGLTAESQQDAQRERQGDADHRNDEGHQQATPLLSGDDAQPEHAAMKQEV